MLIDSSHAIRTGGFVLRHEFWFWLRGRGAVAFEAMSRVPHVAETQNSLWSATFTQCVAPLSHCRATLFTVPARKCSRHAESIPKPVRCELARQTH